MARNVPLYGHLSRAQQRTVRGHVQVLLDEKRFEGCGGLEINDEIRVTIAAHAAMLMLGGPPHYYPRLDAILVYPSPFVMLDSKRLREGDVGAPARATLGLSSRQGVVVIAWDSALREARDSRHKRSTLLHEFAHQLDTEDGLANGVPLLDHGGRYRLWARAFKPEFERLAANPEGTLLGSYAAQNPAEFFAVATEVFFKRPGQFKRQHPEMYAELSRFYGLDLATRRVSTKRSGTMARSATAATSMKRSSTPR